MRIITFNVRNGRSKDGNLSWPFRSAGVRALIQELKPDILCLQEAFRYQIDEIAEALPNHSWFGVGRDDGKDEGEFVPIFVADQLLISSPLPEVEVGEERTGRGASHPIGIVSKSASRSCTFWLSATPDVPGTRSWSSACIRICTWVELDGLRIYNAHLDHESALARLQSVKLIAKQVQSQEKAALICGDFNAGPDQEPIQFLKSAGLVDLAEGTGDTFNAFLQKPDAIERIDYIFGHKISKIANAWVEREPLVSDHWPVVLDLELG